MNKIDMNDVIIGRNIKRYVKIKNTTLDGLANDIGVGYSTMSSWANGKRPVTAYALCRISRALDVAICELVRGVEQEPYK